jgi:hypothetical protein
MKKILVVLILVLAAVYGVGRFNLGESGGMRFMAKMESLMNEGDASAVCEMFHEDLEVTIADHASETPQDISGGKEELCALSRATIAGLRQVPHSMQVEYSDVAAKHTLTSPWTSELSYSEHRTLSVPGANVKLLTVSNDHITLVQTVSGVKLLKVKSELFKADAT